MDIISGKLPGAVKICIYGAEGIGKSTLASQFPDPLFIDTEGGTAQMDVKRLPAPSDWTELLNEVDWVHQHPDQCRTLVLDTADWAEQLCIEHVCTANKKDGIESFGYGKGYTFVAEAFGVLIEKLENVRKKGIHIVITAHATIKKFEQPDELGAYDRWSMKTSKQVAPLIREWVDALLFLNYKTIVVNVDNQGAAKGKNKAQGGKRVIYTTHNPCWDAKNRFGLPDELPLSYDSIRPIIDGAMAPAAAPAAAERPAAKPAAKPKAKPATQAPAAPESALEPAAPPEPPKAAAQDEGIPDKLQALMREADVIPGEVKGIIADKGFYPYDTPWKVIAWDESFMNGWLMHPDVWPKVVEAIKAKRGEEPF